MIFLSKPDMTASDVFPKGMAELVCVDFTCKGRECARENCTHLHPRKVGDWKKGRLSMLLANIFSRRELVGSTNGIS